MGTPLDFQLSNEQQLFIEKALQGENILVDACIGSGKTTAIQNLCNELPSKKKVLYLTYNKLLKLDAKSKIRKKSIMITNYHGFASKILWERGISVGVSDLIQKVIQIKPLVKKMFYIKNIQINSIRTRCMQQYQIMIQREKQNQKQILQYLQLMTAVKVWNEKSVLFLILRKVIGVQEYQNRCSRILF